jgi:hypothetical protein
LIFALFACRFYHFFLRLLFTFDVSHLFFDFSLFATCLLQGEAPESLGDFYASYRNQLSSGYHKRAPGDPR